MSTLPWYAAHLPRRDVLAETLSDNIVRIDRDYPSCICGAGDEFGCKALGVENCRCLAPMTIIERKRAQMKEAAE